MHKNRVAHRPLVHPSAGQDSPEINAAAPPHILQLVHQSRKQTKRSLECREPTLINHIAEHNAIGEVVGDWLSSCLGQADGCPNESYRWAVYVDLFYLLSKQKCFGTECVRDWTCRVYRSFLRGDYRPCDAFSTEIRLRIKQGLESCEDLITIADELRVPFECYVRTLETGRLSIPPSFPTTEPAK